MLLAGALIAILAAQSGTTLIDETVEHIACKAQAQVDCKIVETYQAGTGANGEALVVVEVGRAGTSYTERSCEPYRRDFFLVTTLPSPTPAVSDVRKILSLCNDGYGAAGVGEDDVEVSDNLLKHRQSGGSAWRWETSATYELSPLHLTAQSTCSYHNIGPGFDATEWNLRDFILNGHRKRYACTADGTADIDEDAPLGCALDTPHSQFRTIPRVSLTLPRLADHEMALETSCAVHVDSTGSNGWIVNGTPGDPHDADLWVVSTDEKTIVLAASDDRYVDTAQSWLHADHFEIWLGPGDSGSNCEDAALEPVQWAILASGEVIKARGSANAAPQVEVQRGLIEGAETRLMLAIVRFAKKPERITIVYSDSDDGQSQERLIATSPLVFGKNETLGEIADIPEGAAHCVLRDGVISRTSWGEVSVPPIANK